MKNWCLIAALIIVCGCSNFDRTSESLNYDELVGPVKNVTIKTYKLVDSLGNPLQVSLLDNEYGFIRIEYNRDGNWTNYYSYNEDGKLKWSEHPKYNEKGECIERFDYSYEDDVRKLKKKFRYVNNGWGRIIRVICKNATDSVLNVRFYQYDRRGNTVLVEKYSGRDEMIWCKKSKYDDKNRLLEEVKLDKNGNFSKKTLYQYNLLKKRVEKLIYQEEDNLPSKIQYTYNDHKHSTMIKHFKTDGSVDYLIKQTYQYDDRGNWIKKIILKNDIITSKVEREVEYF